MSSVVEQFRVIVGKVQENILADLAAEDPKIQNIHYEHGHYDEIQSTLEQFEKSREHYALKYPLVALFEDVPYRSVDGVLEARFTIIICYDSDREYKSKDRYEEVINPILMPIYRELLRQIMDSGFYYGYKVDHEMIVRPYAGAQTPKGNNGALFSDILDAIEMRNIRLRLYPDNECD